MSIVRHTQKEIGLIARLMRAEAAGEGELGMLLVGNVIVNRTIAKCLTFKNNYTLTDTVFQSPGGFSGVDSPLFFQAATAKEEELAKRVIKGERFYPATYSLWFYAPNDEENCMLTWYGQKNSGKYLGHCFYSPAYEICPDVF